MQKAASSTRPWLLLSVACALVVIGAVSLLFLRHSRQNAATTPIPALPAAFPNAMPARVLWAWEEPEDLHTLSPTIGVAYLAETILLTDHLTLLPRRQPLLPAPGAPVMAVVRIETRPGFVDTPELRSAVASHLAAYISRIGGIRALQLDFDATASQRAFYTAVLQSLRPQLPPTTPLSITALVSWCGPQSWLHALPIDEAVPMYFRMGGPRALTTAPNRPYDLAEPLCHTSLGLATDEPWPHAVSTLPSATRVYLFAPRPWQQRQLASASTTPLNSLAQELAR